ncbi:MAG: hypothetical protein ABIN89_12600 [Chitinophagaceae bacterium]
MTKIISFLLVLTFFVINVYAQGTTAQTQAGQMAQKMKDSLSLSDLQKSQIETATVGLQNLKINLRQLYTGRALQIYLLMADDNRDSLYKNLLPPDKYLLYNQKKATMFNND